MPEKIVLLRSPEAEGGASAPPAPASQTDPHTASVSEALNQAQVEDDGALNVADQPPSRERQAQPEDDGIGETERSIRDLLTFDPLAEDAEAHPRSKKAKSPTEAPPEGRGKSPQPDKSSAQAKETEQLQEAQQEPPQADELAQTRRELAEARKVIADLAKARAPQAQAEAEPEEDVEVQEQQRLQGIYSTWSVPPNVAEAIASENPVERQQALSWLASTVAREAHFNILKDVREAMSHHFSNLPQIVQGQVAQHRTQSDMNQDLYSAHPDINKTFIRRMVPEIALLVARERGDTSWNAGLRDAVAQRVRSEFGLPGLQAQPQPPPPNGAVAPARPPAAFRTTVRSQPSGYASRMQEDIMQTLGLD